jgi:hypothetical protein
MSAKRTEVPRPSWGALLARCGCNMGHPCQRAAHTQITVVRQMAHKATCTKDRGLTSAAESAWRGEVADAAAAGTAAIGVLGWAGAALERLFIASAAMIGSVACIVGLSGSEMARSTELLGGDTDTRELMAAMGEMLRERHVDDALLGSGEIMAMSMAWVDELQFVDGVI